MVVSGDVNSFPSNDLWGKLPFKFEHQQLVTHRIVQQVEPVIEAVNQSEGVWNVVTLRAEEQQHSQREVFSTTRHKSKNTK